jgi:hypothetical protein
VVDGIQVGGALAVVVGPLVRQVEGDLLEVVGDHRPVGMSTIAGTVIPRS